MSLRTEKAKNPALIRKGQKICIFALKTLQIVQGVPPLTPPRQIFGAAPKRQNLQSVRQWQKKLNFRVLNEKRPKNAFLPLKRSKLCRGVPPLTPPRQILKRRCIWGLRNDKKSLSSEFHPNRTKTKTTSVSKTEKLCRHYMELIWSKTKKLGLIGSNPSFAHKVSCSLRSQLTLFARCD